MCVFVLFSVYLYALYLLLQYGKLLAVTGHLSTHTTLLFNNSLLALQTSISCRSLPRRAEYTINEFPNILPLFHPHSSFSLSALDNKICSQHSWVIFYAVTKDQFFKQVYFKVWGYLFIVIAEQLLQLSLTVTETKAWVGEQYFDSRASHLESNGLIHMA